MNKPIKTPEATKTDWIKIGDAVSSVIAKLAEKRGEK